MYFYLMNLNKGEDDVGVFGSYFVIKRREFIRVRN